MTRIKTLGFVFAVIVLGVLVGAASCPPPNPDAPKDPYKIARMTVMIMRATLKGGKTAFDAVATVIKTDCTRQVCKKLHADETSAAFKDCMTATHSANAEFQKCYGKLEQAVPLVDKAVVLGLSVCDSADEAINLSSVLAQVRQDKALKDKCAGGDQTACTEYDKRVAELCAKVDPTKGDEYKACVVGKPVTKADWVSMLKRGACVTDSSLALVPQDPRWTKYIDAVRAWLRGMGGCTIP